MECFDFEYSWQFYSVNMGSACLNFTTRVHSLL